MPQRGVFLYKYPFSTCLHTPGALAVGSRVTVLEEQVNPVLLQELQTLTCQSIISANEPESGDIN